VPSNGSLLHHHFHHAQDEDWARFSAQAGVSYLVETSLLGSRADTYLSLLGPDGQTELAVNDDCQGQRRSCIVWRAPDSNTAYVRVRAADPLAMDTGCEGQDYFLSIRGLPHGLYLPLLTRSPLATAHRRPAGQALPALAASGGSVESLIVHPHRGWLYTAGQAGAGEAAVLTISDPGSSAVLARVPIAGQPRGMVLDPVADRVYVTGWEQGSVTVLDATSGDRMAEAADLQRPSGLAVVSDVGRLPGQTTLYVAESGAGRLAMLDGKTLERRGEIAVGTGPYALAASTDGQRVYAPLAGAGEVAMLDTTLQEVVARTPLDGLGLPQAVAVHATTGRVYVLYLLGPRYSNIAILDGRSGQLVGLIAATLDHPLHGAQSLAVDAAQQRLYVSDAAGLQVFSTATGEWLATLPASSPASTFGLAVDPQRGRVYGALRGDGQRLSVFP
jgi:DNA-binding beta-propeller fold protein YncE